LSFSAQGALQPGLDFSRRTFVIFAIFVSFVLKDDLAAPPPSPNRLAPSS
jgi:hypothetical protein